MTPTQDEIRQMVERLRGAEYVGHDVGMSGVCFELKDDGLIEDAADLLSRLAQQKPSAWALDFGQGINTMTTFATQKQAASYAVGCAAPTVVVPLYAAPVPVAQQEPVAWRYARPPRSGPEWKYCDYEPTNAPPEWLKEPLYTAPVPAPKE